MAATNVTAETDPYAADTAPASLMDKRFLSTKKLYIGMSEARAKPNNKELIISVLKPLCDNSCPPLNPIENNKYREMNLLEEAGISKSLFTKVAKIPNRKNKSVGLLRLLNNNSNFMSY
jgi:hypothetical protein